MKRTDKFKKNRVLAGFGFKMVMPLTLLEKTVNQNISIHLKDGRIVKGKLVGFDEYMNMVLDNVNETFEDKDKNLGRIILRGNTIISITRI